MSLYHCATELGKPALCGAMPEPNLYDPPEEFVTCTDWSQGDVYCEECLNNEDLILQILANIGD